MRQYAANESRGSDGREQRTRVALLTAVRLYREGLARALAACPSIAVVLDAAPTDEAIGALVTERVDVVLVDAAAVVAGGIARRIAGVAPEAQVVAFGVAEDERAILACATAGADAFVPNLATLEELIATIDAARRGELHCSPGLAAALFRSLGALNRDAPARAGAAELPLAGLGLTTREREVVESLARGLSNKMIAQRLHIEVATVKNHVHRILEKLHVQSRGEAVARVRASDVARDDVRPESRP